MKTSLLTLATLAALHAVCGAASVSITIDSGGKSMRDESNVVLSGGVSGQVRDGTQVVLGYFTDASQAAPFGPITATTDINGNFVALTGPGTPFGVNFTIGDDPDNSAGNGELFVNAFAINTGVADALLPAAGTPLVLRVFNASRTRVLDLANGAGLWNWRSPATVPPTLIIAFDDPGLLTRANLLPNDRTPVAISPAQFNLQTFTVVPEPSSLLLVASGAALLCGRRRRA